MKVCVDSQSELAQLLRREGVVKERVEQVAAGVCALNGIKDGEAAGGIELEIPDRFLSGPDAFVRNAAKVDSSTRMAALDAPRGGSVHLRDQTSKSGSVLSPKDVRSDHIFTHSGKSWTTKIDMSGEFIATTEKIDDIRAALGQPRGAADYERQSPLGFVLGERPGNFKPQDIFNESRAISSTGVNFALALLDDPAIIGGRRLSPDFDMKADFYLGYERFITFSKTAGDRLVARHDQTGEQLRVQAARIGNKHWEPRFYTGEGRRVSVTDVTAVAIDQAGIELGDGRTDDKYDASWWGFCNLYAANQAVTATFGFPEPKRAVTRRFGGREITLDAHEIGMMATRRLAELPEKSVTAGFRYHREPDIVATRTDGRLEGQLISDIDFRRPETQREADTMTLPATAGFTNRYGRPHSGPVFLRLRNGETKEILPDDIVSISREDQSEVLVEEALAAIIQSKGVLLFDNAANHEVWHQFKRVESIDHWRIGDAEKTTRPKWVPANVASSVNKLKGHSGEVLDPDNVVLYRVGDRGHKAHMIAWMELDNHDQPINSGVLHGKVDNYWSISGKLDWSKEPQTNPFITDDIFLSFYLNSIDRADIKHFKEHLPPGWEKYLDDSHGSRDTSVSYSRSQRKTIRPRIRQSYSYRRR